MEAQQARVTTPAQEKVISVDPFAIARFEKQPRKKFDPEWIKSLGQQMKDEGQRTPAIVTPPYGKVAPGILYILINGENRWRAAKKAGIMLQVIVRPVKNEDDHYYESAIANFFCQPHTPMEIAGVVQNFRDERKMTWEQIEAKLGMKSITLRKYYDLAKLHLDIQALVDDSRPRSERLPISVASELARLPHHEQLRVIDEGLIARKSADLATHTIRKRVQEVEKAGGQVFQPSRGRKRRPSDDADMAETHMKRLESEFNLLMSMLPDLKAAFRHRSLERNGETMDRAVQVGNMASAFGRKLLEVMPDNFQAAYVRKK